VAIGDVAFADPEDLVLLFARSNLVILVRNAGSNVTPVSPFAMEVDQDLIYDPDSSGRLPREMNRFHIADGKFRVGDEVAIHASDPDLLNAETLYKFFSAQGEVFVRENQLVYRPDKSGIQQIIAFAFETGQTPARQSLSLDVDLGNGLHAGMKQQSEFEMFSTSDSLNEKPADKVRDGIRTSFGQLQTAGGTRMSDQLLGPWQSYLPQSAGDHTDLGADGTITIDEIELFTGIIRSGTYKDGDGVIVPIQGVVTCIGAGAFALVIEHILVLNRRTRRYEGTVVAQDEEEPSLFIVAGRFRTLQAGVRDGRSAPAIAAAAGQEEGIWVATKP
jgi:hypothetical protein